MTQVVTVNQLDPILHITHQEMLKRAALIRSIRHRLYLGISPESCTMMPGAGLPTCRLSEQTSALFLQQQAIAEAHFDQIICPLIIDSEHRVQSWLHNIQEWLPHGGWWMFATVIQGSFQALLRQIIQRADDDPFQEMGALLKVLTSERAQHPVIDCARYQINYDDSQCMAKDFARLIGEEVSDNLISASSASDHKVNIEVAYVAVKIAPKIRSSMRPISTLGQAPRVHETG